jgi:hypothetical protein
MLKILFFKFRLPNMVKLSVIFLFILMSSSIATAQLLGCTKGNLCDYNLTFTLSTKDKKPVSYQEVLQKNYKIYLMGAWFMK